MPSQRRISQEMDQNARRGANMTIEQRNEAIRMLAAGATTTQVGEHFGRSARTIRDLRMKHNHLGSVEDKPRTGRPPVLSRHTKKLLGRKARAAQKTEYSKLIETGTLVNHEGTTSKPPSRSTVYKALKEFQSHKSQVQEEEKKT
jgi:transposase